MAGLRKLKDAFKQARSSNPTSQITTADELVPAEPVATDPGSTGHVKSDRLETTRSSANEAGPLGSSKAVDGDEVGEYLALRHGTT